MTAANAEMDDVSAEAEAALLEKLNAAAVPERRGKIAGFVWWLIRALASKVALALIAAVLWWSMWLFVIGWAATGSMLSSVLIILKAYLIEVPKFLVTELMTTSWRAMMPAWAVHLWEASMVVMVSFAWGWFITVIVRWAVFLAGSWWFKDRWLIAMAWWRNGAYGGDLRAGLKAVAGLAIFWLAIVLIFDLPPVAYPKTWVVIGLLELLMLGASLWEARSLIAFMRCLDQEMTIAILDHDWGRARRRHEESMRSWVERSSAT